MQPVFSIVVSFFLMPVVAYANTADTGNRPPHIDARAEQAIRKGLQFLAASQDRQGAWRSAENYGTYPVAMTGLATVALMMSGSTPHQGPYAEQVDRAVRYMLSQVQPNGLIASPLEESRSMYGHGFSMLALSQAYGMESDVRQQERLASVLAEAIRLTGESQSADGGWLYTPTSQGDEGSVTVTQVQALRACRNVGLAVPKTVIDQAMGYLDLSMRPDGGIAYRARQFGSSRPPITAAAVVCWYNAGQYDHPNAVKALQYCKQNIGVGASQAGVAGHYYYAHLYYAQALYLSGQQDWDQYFPRIRDFLVSQQQTDGSWEGDGVGKAYGTSIALIILQLPYNQLPIMQR